MQYEQFADGRREALPKPSIDTGMGLERITTVLQGVHSNFQTDLFRHLIAASAEFSHAAAGGENAASHRIIADHLRSSSFLIADGVLPSNEGRGYVLRRIMRRAMRHAHLLGAEDPLMHRLVPTLVAEMGQAYPELKRAEALIAETLKLEETRFRDTLARGLKLLDEATGNLRSGDRLAGEIAFKLYDTFGFPLDLTEDALRARGIAVDVGGFNAAMAKQREEARRAWAGSGEAATDTLWFALREELGNTEFLGYDTEEAEGTILAILRDGARVNRAGPGETVRILDQPDAVLRRIRRPGRRPRHHRIASREGTRGRHRKEARRAACSCRRNRRRRIRRRRWRRSPDRWRAAAGDARQPFGDPSASCGDETGTGRACGAERLAGDARPAAVRFQPSQAGCAGRTRTHREPW